MNSAAGQDAARVWLALGVAVVALANLWPLDLVPPAAWGARARTMLTQRPDAGTVLAAVVWAGLGLLAAAAAVRQRQALAAGVAGAALAVEAVEILAAGRHPGLADGLVAAAAGAGATLAGASLAGLVRRGARAMRWPALLALAVAPPVLVVQAAQMRPFANWSAGFPLVIGQEATHGRAWSGAVHGAALYAGQPAAATLAALPWDAAGQARRRALGAAALCDAGATPLPPAACAPAAGLAAAVRAAGVVTVELRVTPPAAPAEGWPRLLTLSPDPWRRNLTVGQQGDALYLRVRTPFSGTNGLRQGLTMWPGALAGAAPRHLVLRYDGRAVTAWAEGRALAPPRRLYRPAFAAGHDGPAGDVALAGGAGAAAGALAGGATLAATTLAPMIAALLWAATAWGGAPALALAALAALACAAGLRLRAGPILTAKQGVTCVSR